MREMKQSKSKLKKILITLFICFVVVGAVHETDPNYNDKAETTVATTKQTTKFVAKNIEKGEAIKNSTVDSEEIKKILKENLVTVNANIKNKKKAIAQLEQEIPSAL